MYYNVSLVRFQNNRVMIFMLEITDCKNLFAYIFATGHIIGIITVTRITVGTKQTVSARARVRTTAAWHELRCTSDIHYDVISA